MMQKQLDELNRHGEVQKIFDLAKSTGEQAALCVSLQIKSEAGREISEEEEQAVALGTDLGSLWTLANLAFDRGQYDLARVRIIAFIKEARKRAEPGDYIKGLYLLGALYIARGETCSLRFRNLQRKFLQLSRGQHDLWTQYRLYLRRGHLYFMNGKLQRAQFCWTRALKWLTTLDAPMSYEMALLQFYFGLLYRDLGEPSQSFYHLKAALVVAERRQLKFIISKTYRELFYIYCETEKNDEAFNLFKKIESLSSFGPDQVETLILKACLHLNHRQPRKARQLFLTAWVRSRQQRLHRDRFEIPYFLAKCYIKSAQWNKAWRLMCLMKDPVLQLQVCKHYFSSVGRLEREKLEFYCQIAQESNIAIHLQTSRSLLDMAKDNFSKRLTLVYPASATVRIGPHLYNFAGRPLLAALLRFVAKHKQWTKQDVLFEVFGMRHYDPVIHDVKVYQLINKFNKVFKGEPLIHSVAGYYKWNAKFLKLVVLAPNLADENLAEFTLYSVRSKLRGFSVREFRQILHFSSSLSRRLLATLVKSGKVQSTGYGHSQKFHVSASEDVGA